jgi:hypothetical protein
MEPALLNNANTPSVAGIVLLVFLALGVFVLVPGLTSRRRAFLNAKTEAELSPEARLIGTGSVESVNQMAAAKRSKARQVHAEASEYQVSLQAGEISKPVPKVTEPNVMSHFEEAEFTLPEAGPVIDTQRATQLRERAQAAKRRLRLVIGLIVLGAVAWLVPMLPLTNASGEALPALQWPQWPAWIITGLLAVVLVLGRLASLGWQRIDQQYATTQGDALNVVTPPSAEAAPRAELYPADELSDFSQGYFPNLAEPVVAQVIADIADDESEYPAESAPVANVVPFTQVIPAADLAAAVAATMEDDPEAETRWSLPTKVVA